MRLTVVVDDLPEVFARNVEPVGNIVVAAREDDLASRVAADVGANCEVAVRAVEAENPLVLVNIQPIMVGHPAIVLQSFGPAGLFIERRHRNIADLEQFGRSEENEVDGIVINRINDAAFIEEDGLEAALLQLYTASKTGGPRSNDRYVETLQLEQRSHLFIDILERRWQSGRVLPRAFRHVRTAAAFAAHCPR